MNRLNLMVGLLALAASCVATTARPETPDEWITLGARVHGGFGAFIPVGIRIGVDALQRLNAKPREVTVIYYDSDNAPCACFADGVAIATMASVGQRTLRIEAASAPERAAAVIIILSRRGGSGFKYTVPLSTLPRLAKMNADINPRGRYDAVMAAEGLFEVTPVH
jgi:formylmethanofuran dehydrogenase subunit E